MTNQCRKKKDSMKSNLLIQSAQSMERELRNRINGVLIVGIVHI